MGVIMVYKPTYNWGAILYISASICDENNWFTYTSPQNLATEMSHPQCFWWFCDFFREIDTVMIEPRNEHFLN